MACTNEKNISFKIDSGAQCNVISKKIYDQISTKPLQKSHTKPVAFGGHKMRARGKACVVYEYKGRYTLAEFEVVERTCPAY